MAGKQARRALDDLTDLVLDALEGADRAPDLDRVHDALLRMSSSTVCGLHVLELGRPRRAMVAIHPWSALDRSMEEMTERFAFDHPLLRHHILTGDPTVRSPQEVSPEWRSTWVYDLLRREIGVTEQLAVPLRSGARTVRSVAIGRDGTDYSARERALLGRAQRLLVCAGRVLPVLHRATASAGGAGAHAEFAGSGLTPREQEVLAAVSRGRTRHAAARELGISPRTVDKHLENIATKLRSRSLVESLDRARARRHILDSF